MNTLLLLKKPEKIKKKNTKQNPLSIPCDTDHTSSETV